MPKRSQAGSTGYVFHVINRAAKRARLFDSSSDYDAFVQTVAEAQHRVPLPLLAYCIMPNHFHLLVRPSQVHELSTFMHWLTSTHARRWNVVRDSIGGGAVYQGRFKAFPIQADRHFLTVCRYVEQNALRARLVSRAEDWEWSSLAARVKKSYPVVLAAWPILPPSNWLEIVNTLPDSASLDQLRRSVRRGVPFGEASWTGLAARVLEITTRGGPAGRKRKTKSVIDLRKT